MDGQSHIIVKRSASPSNNPDTDVDQQSCSVAGGQYPAASNQTLPAGIPSSLTSTLFLPADTKSIPTSYPIQSPVNPSLTACSLPPLLAQCYSQLTQFGPLAARPLPQVARLCPLAAQHCLRIKHHPQAATYHQPVIRLLRSHSIRNFHRRCGTTSFDLP